MTHPPLDVCPSPSHEAAVVSVKPRRFHISRSTLAVAKGPALNAGISKHARGVPTVFVERSRNGKHLRPRRHLPTSKAVEQGNAQPPKITIERSQLKRPGVANKARDVSQDAPAHAPIPASHMSRHTDDLNNIAADMNQWVLNEIGANLHSMEQEKQQQTKRPRFTPKAPAQRYAERHPELAIASGTQDVAMGDVSEDEGDDDDWIIEEYVRIPANSVAMDVSPLDIGVLVLDDDDESLFFFGPTDDEEDDLDDDENGRPMLSPRLAAASFSWTNPAC